jgi:CheY-like chemotaxis protein
MLRLDSRLAPRGGGAGGCGYGSMSERVLIVDDDADLARALVVLLESERPSLEVLSATDPVTALAWLNDSPPDLLVTDFAMPRLSGLELVMVARERAPQLQVLMISGHAEPAWQLENQGLTTVQFLRKPFTNQDFLARVDRALGHVQQFSGQLQVSGLPDLLQILALGRTTGALRVRRGGDEGRVWFVDGEIHHCQVGELEAADAFVELLRWRGGEFSMDETAVPPVRTLRQSVQALLLDSLRILDEQGAPPAPEPAETVAAPPPARFLARLDLATGSAQVLEGRLEAALPVTLVSALRRTAASSRLEPASSWGSFEVVEGNLAWAVAWTVERQKVWLLGEPASPRGLAALASRVDRLLAGGV